MGGKVGVGSDYIIRASEEGFRVLRFPYMYDIC